MKKAVIFDMYETLITHYESPLYFGTQMAKDAGVEEDRFLKTWRSLEQDRTVGRVSLEDVLERILKENNCYSKKIVEELVEKRKMTKRECFHHLHKEIIPLLETLRNDGIAIGLISNCFSEEAEVIRESILFPYFDAVCLSYEERIQKPEEDIFYRCLDRLSLKPEECIYVGDGGSQELETARKIGMEAVQAVWYLKKEISRLSKPKNGFEQAKTPLKILTYV